MTTGPGRRVALGLVHYPVLDREGAVITTAVTNLDIHDLSRSARAYALSGVLLIHPVPAQRELIERVRAHWVSGGSGARRIPDREAALSLVRAVPSLDEAVSALAEGGEAPELWTTAATAQGEVTSYPAARERLEQRGPPVLLLFGTGWGLERSVLERAALRLAPIEGRGDWNHLSVRAAAAISLDRLLGHR